MSTLILLPLEFDENQNQIKSKSKIQREKRIKRLLGQKRRLTLGLNCKHCVKTFKKKFALRHHLSYVHGEVYAIPRYQNKDLQVVFFGDHNSDVILDKSVNIDVFEETYPDESSNLEEELNCENEESDDKNSDTENVIEVITVAASSTSSIDKYLQSSSSEEEMNCENEESDDENTDSENPIEVITVADSSTSSNDN